MKYTPTENIILRFPHYSLNIIMQALNDKGLFNKIISSEDFQEAIYFSTPTLYEEAIKYINNKLSSKERQKTENALFKYLARMSTRCTPFASLAACTTAQFSEQNAIVLSETEKKHHRLDMLYLCGLSQYLQKMSQIRKSLKYKINSTIYPLGNKYRYITYSYGESKRFYQLIEINKNSILAFIIQKAQSYITLQQLTQILSNTFTFDNKEEIEEYLLSLIDNQILINEVDTFITGPDFFDYLLSTVKEKTDESFYSHLNNTNNFLTQLNANKSFQGKQVICENIENELKEIGVPFTKKYLLQLDTIRLLKKAEVSKSIISQLQNGLVFLNRITTHYESNSLKDFKQRFYKRYEEQEIPLLEVLDPDIGIGYGMNQDRVYNPLIEDLILPRQATMAHRNTSTPLFQLLLNKLMVFNSETDNTIELTDADIQDFPESWSNLPPSLSAIFKIIKYNPEQQNYTLSDLHFVGCSAANLLTRFAYCSTSIKETIESIVNKEQELTDDSIIMEIAHIPDSRVGNILARPFLRALEFVYLTNSIRDDKQIITPSDIVVSIRKGKIMLRSKKLNKYLLPRLTSAHNFSNSPTPIYLFFCDLQSQSIRPSLYFSWENLDNIYEYLPRVVYQNMILSTAKWKLKKKDSPLQSQTVNTEALNNWRKKYHLPRYVSLVEGDNKLMVDLENNKSIASFLSELTHKEIFILEEFIASEGVAIDEKGKYYMNECILPFIKNSL